MRRRDFMKIIGGAATAWPLAARAQQAAMPLVGFLNGVSPEGYARYVAAFRQGLGESGFVEGRNIAIAWMWAYGQYGRLPALAADMVRQQPTMILASGGDDAVHAAKAATASIPIVAMFGADPVEAGLVGSINRPGGNITGVTQFSVTLAAMRMALLRELLPGAETIAVLSNPTSPTVAGQTREVERAARALGIRSHIVTAIKEGDFEGAFATMLRERAAGLVVLADPFFTISRATIVALAAHHGVPAIYNNREYPLAGGLMSYSPDTGSNYRQLGLYAGQVLKGARPADLPVMQPAKFELVINLKAAKALGVTVPLTLLARADEVIE
jgi:putative ABC transport system substrate-binding protein